MKIWRSEVMRHIAMLVVIGHQCHWQKKQWRRDTIINKLFIVVKDGLVEEVYSTMAPEEIRVEVLDMDGIHNAPEMKEYLENRRAAAREILYRLD